MKSNVRTQGTALQASNTAAVRKLLLGILVLSCAGFLPAFAGGGTFASGTVPSGNCAGGVLGLSGANTSGQNWIFDVSLGCPTQTPQHIVIAGNWNPAVGGPVTGFGDGSLMIGPITCGGTSNVNVQLQMFGSPLVDAKATFNRFCN